LARRSRSASHAASLNRREPHWVARQRRVCQPNRARGPRQSQARRSADVLARRQDRLSGRADAVGLALIMQRTAMFRCSSAPRKQTVPRSRSGAGLRKEHVGETGRSSFSSLRLVVPRATLQGFSSLMLASFRRRSAASSTMAQDGTPAALRHALDWLTPRTVIGTSAKPDIIGRALAHSARPCPDGRSMRRTRRCHVTPRTDAAGTWHSSFRYPPANPHRKTRGASQGIVNDTRWLVRMDSRWSDP
jgi:hypothetical protein